MNNSRRKELEHAVSLLEEAQSIIESCRDDEQDYLDNMPENLQSSERYGTAENAIECLDDAWDKLSDVIDNVNSATE